MDRIDPSDGLGLLDRLDVEIDGNRLAIAAHQHTFEHVVGAGIDLLMRHIGRDIDEIARAGLGHEFEMITPTHAGTPFDDINDAFEVPVVMRARLCIGVDGHRTGPDLLGTDAGEIDCGLAIHAWRLRGIGVELAAGDNADAVMLPGMVVMRGHRKGSAVIHRAMMALRDKMRQVSFFERNQGAIGAEVEMLGGPSPLSENLTREEGLMRKSALHYLGQRITSFANLKRVLARRAQRKLRPQVDATGMIERTIDYCRGNGFVDNAAFMEARIHSGRGKGLSRRRIGAAPGAKGIDRLLIAAAFDADDANESEERSAALFAQRKRIGPWRRPEQDYDFRGEVAVLARAGYLVDLARRILTPTPEEAEVMLG